MVEDISWVRIDGMKFRFMKERPAEDVIFIVRQVQVKSFEGHKTCFYQPGESA